MIKVKIKKNDTVVVISGRDKGKTGRVLSVLPQAGKVIVEGIQVVKRHRKASGGQPGSVISKESAIAISNVALWDVSEGKRIKVSYSVVDGKKVRVNRATGAVVDAS